MNFIKNIFSSTYEELWKAVIRPNRDNYRDKDLGPEKFELKDKWYKRTDFTITNKRNLKLACSFWEPFDEEREYPHLPCVIYLHGNSSSRCEVIPEIKYLLPKNITVFAFDFSGCGKSEGDYISLGWHEQDDVECVVNFLRKSNKVSTIGLWGRSMGAVTAIMYGSKDLSIAGLVLDSPFSSLKILIDELAKERVALPEFIVNQAIKLIKEIIKDKADFNLDDIEPKEYAKKCFIPAYFCHSKEDSFVNIHHCKDLFKIYAGDKSIVYVKGNHNTERPIHFKDSVALFFYKALRCKSLKEKYENENFFNLKFNNENILYENINNNKVPRKKKNNSVGEIKISLRGRYNRNNFKFDDNFNNNLDKNKLMKSDDKEIIDNSDDDFSAENIIESRNMDNYNKSMNDINNSPILKNKTKKLFWPSFDYSFLNKTLSKHINDNTFEKNETENKIQNDKDEETIQKILQLSKKEFEEISTNTPNFLNYSNNISGYKKKALSIKKNIIENEHKSISNKNSISLVKNKIPNVNINIPIKSKKPNLISNKSMYYNSKNINKNEILNYYRKINNFKIVKNRNISNNKLTKININNQFNNIVFKDIKNNKTTKNKPNSMISSYIQNCPKPSGTKDSFPNFSLHFKKTDINDFRIDNIKNNYNNISIHHIYNIKNKKNTKLKDNSRKEEHKNMANNKGDEFLEKVLASPLNNNLHGNINKLKKNQYVNTTNNTSSNNIVINKNIKKSESSLINDSETFNINSNINNKINNSLVYIEDDDNFFLEEENIGINIPHS